MKNLKLYLLTQNDNRGYDTYDSCLVAANSEDEARQIHPCQMWDCSYGGYKRCDWANSPKSVIVEAIGIAKPSIKTPCVIISSFNAG